MTLSEFQQLVTTLAGEGEKLIDAATTASSLEEARTSLLGRKSGRLPELFKQLPSLAPEELREGGSLINAVKAKLDTRLIHVPQAYRASRYFFFVTPSCSSCASW